MFYKLLSIDTVFKSNLPTVTLSTRIHTKSCVTLEISEFRNLTEVKLNQKFLIAGVNDLYKKRK
jgi:hypothetical protein